MPRYAGFGTAAESNAGYRRLVSGGATALAVTFDLPTRMGHDSDARPASGQVGRTGVAIDSLDDMRVLFGGIPLDEVSTSLTVNAPAAALLLLYQLVGEEQGVPGRKLTGTVHKDVAEEYLTRGTDIFPPVSALRLVADMFAYCRAELPGWDALSLSGHRLAEAGASAAQEVAFLLAEGIEYVRTAVAAGWAVDEVAPRLSFHFTACTGASPETVAFRAAQRVWARVMAEEFGARSPASLVLRRGAWTSAAGRPAARPPSARETVDGIEAAVRALLARVEELGGAADATGAGFQQGEIERSARPVARWTGPGGRAGDGRAGTGRTGDGHAGPDAGRPSPHEEERGEEPCVPAYLDPATETRQAERIAKLRAWRCHERVGEALTGMQKAAAGADNVLYPMKEALASGATVGEVCDALRGVWGTRVPHGTV